MSSLGLTVVQGTETQSLDLSRLVGLRSLVLNFVAEDRAFVNRFVYTTLGTLPRTTAVESITLNLSDLFTGEDDEGTEWERFDALLTREGQMKALRRVQMRWRLVMVPINDVVAFALRWMPNLASKGYLFMYRDEVAIFPPGAADLERPQVVFEPL